MEIGAPGVQVGGGFYRASAAGIAALRTAIDGPAAAELAKIVSRLRRARWEITGNRVKTSPRGFDLDHPRIDLLRHRSLAARKIYGFDSLIHTAALLGSVRRDWNLVRPLVEWFAVRLAGTADQRGVGPSP